jgi:hypothetical protein
MPSLASIYQSVAARFSLEIKGITSVIRQYLVAWVEENDL